MISKIFLSQISNFLSEVLPNLFGLRISNYEFYAFLRVRLPGVLTLYIAVSCPCPVFPVLQLHWKSARVFSVLQLQSALRATWLSEQTGFSILFCLCTSIPLSFVLSTVLWVARHCGIEVHITGWSSTRVSFRSQFRAYFYFRLWHSFRDNKLNSL